MKSFQLQKRDEDEVKDKDEVNDEMNDEMDNETFKHEVIEQSTNERVDLESLKASNQLN